MYIRIRDKLAPWNQEWLDYDGYAGNIPNAISATTFADNEPIRLVMKEYFQGKYKEELKPEAFMGTALHYYREKVLQDSDLVIEERLCHEFEGKIITAQSDLRIPSFYKKIGKFLIDDFKSVKCSALFWKIKMQNPTEWVCQESINRWLIKKKYDIDTEIDGNTISVFLRDWNRRTPIFLDPPNWKMYKQDKRLKSDVFPKSLFDLEIGPLWSYEETEEYMGTYIERYKFLKENFPEQQPSCENRFSQDMRCHFYCDFKDLCKYYRENGYGR
jgi:hypothetical protein